MDVHAVVLLSLTDAITRSQANKTPRPTGLLFGLPDGGSGRAKALQSLPMANLASEQIAEREELVQAVDPSHRLLGLYAVSDGEIGVPILDLAEPLRNISQLTGQPSIILLITLQRSTKSEGDDRSYSIETYDGDKPLLMAWSVDGSKDATWSELSVRVITSSAEKVALNDVLTESRKTGSDELEKYKRTLTQKKINSLETYLDLVSRGSISRQKENEKLISRIAHVIRRASLAPLPHAGTAQDELNEDVAMAQVLALLILRADETICS